MACIQRKKKLVQLARQALQCRGRGIDHKGGRQSLTLAMAAAAPVCSRQRETPKDPAIMR